MTPISFIAVITFAEIHAQFLSMPIDVPLTRTQVQWEAELGPTTPTNKYHSLERSFELVEVSDTRSSTDKKCNCNIDVRANR